MLSEITSSSEQLVHDQFKALVLSPAHPCLGAHASLRRDRYGFRLYDVLGSEAAARQLTDDLHAFNTTRRRWGGDYSTYIAAFRGPQPRDEADFEALLWRQLQKVHDLDCVRSSWDSRVSRDPTSPHFSFSVGGEAFFVVGLHASASRYSRRFAWPTLCFNPHDQFERLRSAGLFNRMRERVRSRDSALQGSRNPMLDDHGTRSEAVQYSGRAVEEDWRCPLRVDPS